MKSVKVKLNDEVKTPQPGWSMGTFSNVWNVGSNLQTARKISGWQLRSPDGCLRACEGNWQQFVPFANQILENYGCVPDFS